MNCAALAVLVLVSKLGYTLEDSIPSTSTCRLEGTCGKQDDTEGTVHEIGLETLASVFGERPVSWKERTLANILSSIDEAGFGQVNELQLEFSSWGREDINLIAKRFEPKPFANVGGSAMEQVEFRRHMDAFAVEASTYVNLSTSLRTAGLAAPEVFFHTEVAPDRPFTFLIQDLSSRFPRGAKGQKRRMSRNEVSAAIRWLAGFHALSWEDARAPERGLWPRGSYWILDELGSMEMASVPKDFQNRYISNDEWSRLRTAAVAIDQRLASNATLFGVKGNRTEFRTLIHGDAKPENVLCYDHGSSSECAALDFAWTGEGYGMYDVMYLLWGEYTQDIVDAYLEEYYKELTHRLPPEAQLRYNDSVMKNHFDLCVVDFMRWWAGFREGRHFWAMPWALDAFRRVLDRLDGGELLDTDSYVSAVLREYPF